VPISRRFDKKTKYLLEQDASPLNKSGKIKRKKPYDLVEDLLDKGGSGRGDLSLRSEEILRRRFKRSRP